MCEKRQTFKARKWSYIYIKAGLSYEKVKEKM